MDNRALEANASANPPAAPGAPSMGYPKAGNPQTNDPASKPGPYWFFQIGEELRNVIAGAGLTPDLNDNTQLRAAILSMIQSANSAVIILGATFEASVADGEAVRWDAGNNRFDEAIADGTANNQAVGFADVTNSKVYCYGETPALFAGLTPGARYYLDGTTPGAITTIAPSDKVFVGIAKSATTLFVDIDHEPASQSNAISAVRNLHVYPHAATPDTRFMVSFDEAVLLDASGNPLVVRPAGAYECICTTVGAGGMDAGALAASAWYHVWGIVKTDGTLDSVILSLSATAPTLPNGYTHKIYLGVRRTTSGSVLERDEQRGAKVAKQRAWEDVVFSGAAGVTAWTAQSLSSFVPPNAVLVSLRMGLNTTGTRSIGIRGENNYEIANDYGECSSATVDGNWTGRAFKDVVMAVPQTIYWIAQDTNALYRMVVLDYTLGNVNAN